MNDSSTSDPRIIRTRERLWRAMVDLTLAHGYDTVTIRDIVAEANVGYATFFRHYPDKDALLQDVLARSLDEIETIIQRHNPQLPASVLGQTIFEYVAEHQSVCRVLVDQRSPASLRMRVMAAVVQHIGAQQRKPAREGVPGDIIMHHIAVSSLNLIGWWLDHGMPYSPEHMGTIYASLIVEPFQ